MDNNETFFSILMEALPVIMEPHVRNKSRDELSLREALIDMRSERIEGDDEIKSFRNEAGAIITERNKGGIVTYRKTLRPNEAYVSEYFDDNGVLARRLKVYRYGGIDDIRFDDAGKRIGSLCSDSVKHWFEFHEKASSFSRELTKEVSKL